MDDLISKRAVNTLVDELARAISDERCCISRGRSTATIMQDILDLPSTIPQPKTGRWEWVQYDYNPKIGNWHCSECRSVIVECVNKEDRGGIPLYKYCPQCGAMMVEPQEISDHKCHNCKHYTSGDRDGSCGSYICKHYSGWESEDKE